MAVDFATFLATAPLILDAKLPVLIRGRHGVGKSQIVYQIAADRSLPVEERRASQMTEGDLLGLPDTTEMADGRKATTWNAPDWLVRGCTEPTLIFLDEVDRATMEVRQGLFELTDSRKINGWVLHPETLIVAAVNGGEHGAQYQVGEMDPAELDRWTVFDVEPTDEDWLKWANGKVTTLVWDFINHNRVHLEHKGDFEPNKVYPSRRSWERFNKTASPAGVFDEGGNLDLMFNLAVAFLGFEAAVALKDFTVNYAWQVTVEDILDRGQVEKTTKWGINDHAAMIEKFEASGAFTKVLTPSQIINLADYFVTLPSEISMKLWTVIGDNDNVANVMGFHQATSSTGVKVVDFLVKILGAG
jgi:hypothetical protein